jgi:transketolase
MKDTIDTLVVNTIKILSAEAVENANSGHPGMPMGCADIAYVLFQKFLNFNPNEPDWVGRDRFILSAGHGSMLLYSLLHLYGYDLPLSEIKRFRQLGSKTPGHPEFGHTPGVEVTTGPLGQGFAMGVGMAISAFMLKEQAALPLELFNQTIYSIVSDGDLMEGVSAEAASLAGHLGLGNMVYIYDCNGISIEGSTALTFSENVKMRFAAYNWHTLEIDGHDRVQIENAISAAKRETSRPSLIIAKTRIANGSPHLAGSEKAHGSPLGKQELLQTKENLGWTEGECFSIPASVYEKCRMRVKENQIAYDTWQKKYTAWKMENPDRALGFEKWRERKFDLKKYRSFSEPVLKEEGATRAISGKLLQMISKEFPFFVGGSADLAPSTNTLIHDAGSIAPLFFKGKNIHFGIREHAMAAIANGMSVFGFFRPYCGTFLVFSDYMRPAMRLASLMKVGTLFILTHDSFHLGEDGPTHQPIEHLASLRLIPGLRVTRPADALEVVAAFEMALEQNDSPTAIVLSRQKLPRLTRVSEITLDLVKRGAYVISETASDRFNSEQDLLIMASGSELGLALEVQKTLANDTRSNYGVRVVSMMSTLDFDRQDPGYRETVLPEAAKYRISIEAGSTAGWYRYIGREGLAIGLDTFGASAPSEVLAGHFGFTAGQIVERIIQWKKEMN